MEKQIIMSIELNYTLSFNMYSYTIDEGYLGCFRDDSLTDLLRGDNVSIHEIIPDGTSVSVSPSNFINFCINYCRNSSLGNFTHAGVRSGIECFCTEVGGNFSLQGMVDDQSCRLPCPSESDTSCNNTGLTNVFDRKIFPPSFSSLHVFIAH